jgi:hypothetical protein
MTVSELIAYLQNPHCPKDALVEIETYEEKTDRYVGLNPQVVWWSDDRKTAYLGKI